MKEFETNFGKGPTPRQEIYKAIDVERAYQDAKWGGPDHDDSRETEESFAGYVREYACGEGRGAAYDFRTRMVKVAALAVAAIERHDRLAAKKPEGDASR